MKPVIITFNRDIFETKGRNKKRIAIFLEGMNYFGKELKDGTLKAFSIVHNRFISVDKSDVIVLTPYQARHEKHLYMSLLDF